MISHLCPCPLLDKAQEVEAELLESHQEETQQLHRKIAEKEDDLKRTARRYEEILDVPCFPSLLKCSSVLR